MVDSPKQRLQNISPIFYQSTSWYVKWGWLFDSSQWSRFYNTLKTDSCYDANFGVNGGSGLFYGNFPSNFRCHKYRRRWHQKASDTLKLVTDLGVCTNNMKFTGSMLQKVATLSQWRHMNVMASQGTCNCLFNSLFRITSNEISKFHIIVSIGGLWDGFSAIPHTKGR